MQIRYLTNTRPISSTTTHVQKKQSIFNTTKNETPSFTREPQQQDAWHFVVVPWLPRLLPWLSSTKATTARLGTSNNVKVSSTVLTVKQRMSAPSSWIHTLVGSNKKCQLAFGYKSRTLCYNSNGLDDNRDIQVRIYRDRHWVTDSGYCTQLRFCLFKNCSSLSTTS